VKTKDAIKLKPGDKIMHKRYGLCEVREVMLCGESLFGVIVRPEKKRLLAADSGTNIPDMLEDSVRRLTPLQADAAGSNHGDGPE
jgi:hypothetical protein